MLELEEKILGAVEAEREELFSLLSALIRHPTENYLTRGNEKDCADYIAGVYRKAGLETAVYFPDSVPGIQQHPSYLAGRNMGERPNVTGILHGTDSIKKVMLAAHMDTMPAGELSKWTVPPFEGIVRDGRIYGRGACDDKFGIAAAYSALRAIGRCGVRLKNDVLLTSYADEEYGGGDGSLAACLKYPCDTYVNLDGGKFELWVCSVGGQGLKLNIQSQETLDSSDRVAEALHMALGHILAFGERRRGELSRNPYFRGSEIERSALRVITFRAGEGGVDLDKGTIEFVYYTDQSKSSIAGEVSEMWRQIQIELQKMGMRSAGFTPSTRFFECAAVPEDDPAASLMAQAVEQVTGKPVVKTGACLSDLSIYLTSGSPSSFNFGILRDFKLYGGAHQPDEFVDCTDLIHLTQAIALFLLRWDQK